MKQRIMWILNVTPDSFYDGWKYLFQDQLQHRIESMIEDGIDIIDVWGFSSKPGSKIPSEQEELERILPALEILEKYDIPVSVDTCRSQVVKEILHYKNIRYINDISGLTDTNILPLIRDTGIWYILMHTQGKPENMQNNPQYKNIVTEIYEFFEKKISILQWAWINNIVIDPGFWFGKTLDHNYEILRNLDTFTSLGFPLLVWLSRKSMISKLLNTVSEDTLIETVSLNMFALVNWANILRVHDVKEHVRMRKLFWFII